MREIGNDGEVDELAKVFDLASFRQDFEISKASKSGRDSANNCTRFPARVTIVKHIASDLFAGQNETESSRCGTTQVVHRFAAKELAYRGTQHRQPVSRTRVRSPTRTFQLHDPTITTR